MDRFYLTTPIGNIEIITDDQHIHSIEFFDDEIPADYQEPVHNKVSRLCVDQLTEYFNGTRTDFSLPIHINGTEFQNRVWHKLLEIPFGKTISYSTLANRLGDPKCIRAAASANGRNPFVIVVPCHRVIGKDGSLTGYGGGLWRKKWLLEHEKVEGFVNQPELF